MHIYPSALAEGKLSGGAANFATPCWPLLFVGLIACTQNR